MHILHIRGRTRSNTFRRLTPGSTFLKRLLSKITPAVFSITLLAYFTYGLPERQIQIQEDIQSPETNTQILGVESQSEDPAPPARLKIPKINVDTAVQYVGLTPQGAMDVPNNSVDVGWFDQGPFPGQKGNAVIAGHVNTEYGAAGVFADLHKLKKGDAVYVEDANGMSIAFTVRESHIYSPGYADGVFNSSDQSHLNLITCTGWDDVTKNYNKRLVVFTDIVN